MVGDGCIDCTQKLIRLFQEYIRRTTMIPWVANDRAAAGVYRLSSENKALCAIFHISILSPIDSLARNSDNVGRQDKISRFQSKNSVWKMWSNEQFENPNE